MAKKKTKGAGIGHRTGKTRVELRLDEDVYSGIKKLADGSQITVNQLINGIVRWAGEKGHVGEPKRTEDGVVRSEKIPGVVWFGDRLYYFSDEDKERFMHENETDSAPAFRKGEHYFTLDFTERRIVRDDV